MNQTCVLAIEHFDLIGYFWGFFLGYTSFAHGDGKEEIGNYVH